MPNRKYGPQFEKVQAYTGMKIKAVGILSLLPREVVEFLEASMEQSILNHKGMYFSEDSWQDDFEGSYTMI